MHWCGSRRYWWWSGGSGLSVKCRKFWVWELTPHTVITIHDPMKIRLNMKKGVRRTSNNILVVVQWGSVIQFNNPLVAPLCNVVIAWIYIYMGSSSPGMLEFYCDRWRQASRRVSPPLLMWGLHHYIVDCIHFFSHIMFIQREQIWYLLVMVQVTALWHCWHHYYSLVFQWGMKRFI